MCKCFQYRYARLTIALLLLFTMLGCGNRSPIVEGDSTDTIYTGTRISQFSKPFPPGVLVGTGLAVQPPLQVQIARCCHQVIRNRIGGKPAPHTGCDCEHHPHQHP